MTPHQQLNDKGALNFLRVDEQRKIDQKRKQLQPGFPGNPGGGGLGERPPANSAPALRERETSGTQGIPGQDDLRSRQRRRTFSLNVGWPDLPGDWSGTRSIFRARPTLPAFLWYQQGVGVWKKKMLRKGPFTHAIFDAISGAISRTKCALPYPARMFFSCSIAWIGKKVITYYFKTPFFPMSANLAVFCRRVTRLQTRAG